MSLPTDDPPNQEKPAGYHPPKDGRFMWFLRGVQSAVFYYAARTPCLEWEHKRSRRKEADKAAKEQERIILQQPGLIRKPVAFQTNPAWAEEILRGPGPPKGWKGDTIVRNLQKKRPDLIRKASLSALEELCREANPPSPPRSKGLEDSTTIAASPSPAQTPPSPATNEVSDLSRPSTQDSAAAGMPRKSATHKEPVQHHENLNDSKTESATNTNATPQMRRGLSKLFNGLTQSKIDHVDADSNTSQMASGSVAPYKESPELQSGSQNPNNDSPQWTKESTKPVINDAPQVNNDSERRNDDALPSSAGSMRPHQDSTKQKPISTNTSNNNTPPNNDSTKQSGGGTKPTMERRLSSAVENIKESLISKLHPEKWNWRRYDREDELKGFRERIEQWYRDLSGNSGNSTVLPNGMTGKRKRSKTNESDHYDYYRGRAPMVNDLHPPVASQLPSTHEDAAWMLLPPPSAAVMSGLQRPRPDEPMRYPMNIIGSRFKRTQTSPARSKRSEKSPAPSPIVTNKKRRHESTDTQDYFYSSGSDFPMPAREWEESRDFSNESIMAPEPVLVAGAKGKRTVTVTSLHFSEDCTWTSTG